MERPTSLPPEGGTSSPNRGPRLVAGLLATVLIAFCAWSMTEYLQGRDPLAFALGSDALQTTVEAGEESTDQDEADGSLAPASKASDQEAESGQESSDGSSKTKASSKSSKGSKSGKGSKSRKTSSGDVGSEDKAAETDGSPESSPAEDAPAADQAEEVVTYVEYETLGQASAQDSQPAPAASVPEPATILVTLSIDGGGGISSATIELDPGATAFDALTASGVGVQAGPYPYGSGTWVTSIGGLAEEAGHGWTYRVNGALPGMMSDLYQLSDGDTVLWQYV